ncbi:MAG: hypothetical protein ACYC4Q_12390, partial [Victivallaceae bacterium]
VILLMMISAVFILRLILPVITGFAKRNQVYVITGKRVIVWNGRSSAMIKSYFPEDIQAVSVRKSERGTGDIFFNAETDYGPMGKYKKTDAVLSCVGNIEYVEGLLKDLAGKKKLF